MIKDDIKKANLLAMKNKNQTARALYSVVLNKIMLAEVKLRGTDKTLSEGDILAILQKTNKELDEEKAGFEKVGNAEKVADLEKQQTLLAQFLPKMLSRAEVENIIATLEDKSVGAVMKYFKQNHNGTCDMQVVKSVLDGLK